MPNWRKTRWSFTEIQSAAASALAGLRLGAVATLLSLLGCAAGVPDSRQLDPQRVQQVVEMLPIDALLLGEQHDVPDHQRIHLLTVETLAARKALAAVTLEMAAQGQSTDALAPDATEDQVRTALAWDSQGWPWAAYGPVVMAAVRAGVPVVGANLPLARQREAMQDASLDTRLPASALLAQQQAVRSGHCQMLPESQIAPMTRIQIARDVAMAHTLRERARPNQTVLLLAGSAHVDRQLGAPLHLGRQFQAKSVLLHARQAQPAIEDIASFDLVWITAPAPLVDYCAEFAARKPRPAL